MIKNKLPHSKYFNTVILFESLGYQIAKEAIDKSSMHANKILHNYFNPSSELVKELFLYQNIMQSDTVSTQHVDLILETHSNSINKKKLRFEKINLIKEIKSKYNLDDIVGVSIPNFKHMASIYKLFETYVSNNNFVFESSGKTQMINPTEILKCYNVLTEQPKIKRTTSTTSLLENEDKLIVRLTHKILQESFIDELSHFEIKNQKDTLNSIVIGDYDTINRLVTESLKTIQEFEGLTDVVQKTKINEVVNVITEIDDFTTDVNLSRVMNLFELENYLVNG